MRTDCWYAAYTQGLAASKPAGLDVSWTWGKEGMSTRYKDKRGEDRVQGMLVRVATTRVPGRTCTLSVCARTKLVLVCTCMSACACVMSLSVGLSFSASLTGGKTLKESEAYPYSFGEKILEQWTRRDVREDEEELAAPEGGPF